MKWLPEGTMDLELRSPLRPLRKYFVRDPRPYNQKPPSLGVLGAGDGTRTHDLLLGKETFYQLNHARAPATYRRDFT